MSNTISRGGIAADGKDAITGIFKLTNWGSEAKLTVEGCEGIYNVPVELFNALDDILRSSEGKHTRRQKVLQRQMGDGQ